MTIREPQVRQHEIIHRMHAICIVLVLHLTGDMIQQRFRHMKEVLLILLAPYLQWLINIHI
jgi:hypothetical protein